MKVGSKISCKHTAFEGPVGLLAGCGGPGSIGGEGEWTGYIDLGSAVWNGSEHGLGEGVGDKGEGGPGDSLRITDMPERPRGREAVVVRGESAWQAERWPLRPSRRQARGRGTVPHVSWSEDPAGSRTH